MQKFFKYSWRILLIIAIFFIACYLIVLHTQMGARWTINYFTHKTDLKIESIEGTLANNLKLTGISYNDKTSEIKAKQLTYQIKQIHWFAKKLIIEEIVIENIDLKILEEQSEESNNEVFEGFTLPFELEVYSLHIQEIKVNTTQAEQQTEVINQIQLALKAKNQRINVSKLFINHENFNLNGEGLLQLEANLPFTLTSNWVLNSNENSIIGAGVINGNINQIDLNQKINSTQGSVIGDIKLDANIDFRLPIPDFNISISTNKLTYENQDFSPLNFESLEAHINGSIDQYSIKSNFILSNNEIEKSAIQLNGMGNLESIDLNKLIVTNSQGSINSPTILNWNKDFSVKSNVNITQFNPATYFPDWPGLVNGSANLSFLLSDDGYLLSIDNMMLDGMLKQEKFSAQGKVLINPVAIIIDKAQIILGQNKLDINAIIKEGNIDADIIAALNDLSILDKQAEGIITSQLNIKGDIKNPQVIGQAHIEKAKYLKYKASSIDVQTNGKWSDDFLIQTKATGVEVGDNFIESINLDIKGNIQNHEISLALEDENITTQLQAKGSLNYDTYNWNGDILNHKILLKDINSTWELKEPVKLVYKNKMSLSNACWINQQTSGDACLNFAFNTTTNTHQINLDLNKLNVRFLKIFLPSNLIVNGNLDGTANINLTDGNLKIDSVFNLLDGELQFLNDSKPVYSTKVLAWAINAKQVNQTSIINSLIKLDDGTELNFDLDLINSVAHVFEVKGVIEGVFTNTQYFASLSEEIEEMSGNFNFKGVVEGPLSDIRIKFDALQNQGHLILSQTKTKIQNLDLKLIKESNNNLEFVINGLAGNGKFVSKGTLDINNETKDSSWEVIANLKGENMRLLTLPELEVDVTPDLMITVNNNRTKITGNTIIPYASVNIKQLPETAISSSPDVVIHTSEVENFETENYPIIFEISAQIENPIKVDILGLKSGLKGQLKVTNTENSRINGYGSLQLIDGKYSIYGQTLDISKGELLFNGAIENPSIDVIASRKSLSGDVTAGVELGGTINYLQSSLYSDPLLTDLEILSYILSGRGLNEESSTNSQQLAQAAILLGLKKSSPIFSEIQSKLGIDVLTIKEGATSKDSVVEAGKQVNENLYVGYNQGLFSRIGFWVLRYQINQALRLETTQGETQSVDLIYVRKKK